MIMRHPLTEPHAAEAADVGTRNPLWEKPALLGLLFAAALLYLWDLSASGWANAFYSAAVQAGTQELEGVLLRLVRRLQLHHRRQAARRRCG